MGGEHQEGSSQEDAIMKAMSNCREESGKVGHEKRTIILVGGTMRGSHLC